MNKAATILVLAWSATTGAAQAAVIDSLPYPGTPDWTDVVLSGASMTLNAAGTETTLSTSSLAGVWFGWGDPVNYRWYPTPAWTLGTNAEGNHLSLTARLGNDSFDWSAYVLDGSYQAAFNFAPCGSYSCSGAVDGVRMLLPDNPDGSLNYLFVPLDTNVSHTYEFLLKNGQVSYRIDGTVYYSGAARSFDTSASGLRVLVIGDGSGSDPTGMGSMTVQGIRLETGPVADSLAPVPLPAAAWLFGSGLMGLVVAARRRN